MTELNELYGELAVINEKIKVYESELYYLDQLLVSTAGPMSDAVEEEHRTKEKLQTLRNQYDSILGRISILKGEL